MEGEIGCERLYDPPQQHVDHRLRLVVDQAGLSRHAQRPYDGFCRHAILCSACPCKELSGLLRTPGRGVLANMQVVGIALASARGRRSFNRQNSISQVVVVLASFVRIRQAEHFLD